jgi:anaerobic magnesium-protoporphyrin IX monomethyl ester cyclase
MRKALSIVLLNLPNSGKVTRRYMCSYVSPESLMPPLELLSAGACARAVNGADVVLVDAIAERLGVRATLARIGRVAPDVVLTISGFECFEEDMAAIRKLKAALPQVHFTVFGHYATMFPEETLAACGADTVVMGEPEEVFSNLLTALEGHAPIDDVQGIARSVDGRPVRQGGSARIAEPGTLPMPAIDLIADSGPYHEPLMPRPYGMIQTARGCPYRCNYCVKSYGSRLTVLSPERVVEEMGEWKRLHGVRSIRFIDDTFTIDRRRVLAICRQIVDSGLNIPWACLSRTDNLDPEMLRAMREAGCMRIYFGMESGSQRMLDIYRKNTDADESLKALHQCREAGIQTAGFFIAGHPDETEDDFLLTLAFARKARLTFASFGPLTPYPGTAMFDEWKDRIDFSIHPYRNRWKDDGPLLHFDRWKTTFYRDFYFRWAYFADNMRVLFTHLPELTVLAFNMLRYLYGDRRFVIPGIKGPADR